MTPEAGKAYQDAEGRVAIFAPDDDDNKDTTPWIVERKDWTGHRTYLPTDAFTPLHALGPILSEAEIERRIDEAWSGWIDRSAFKEPPKDHWSRVLRKHFSGTSLSAEGVDNAAERIAARDKMIEHLRTRMEAAEQWATELEEAKGGRASRPFFVEPEIGETIATLAVENHRLRLQLSSDRSANASK